MLNLSSTSGIVIHVPTESSIGLATGKLNTEEAFTHLAKQIYMNNVKQTKLEQPPCNLYVYAQDTKRTFELVPNGDGALYASPIPTNQE